MGLDRPLKVYVDGGCRPNPGRIEVAVVARGEIRFFDDLGEGGNGEAEWLALCLGLEVAQSLAVPLFDLLGDNRGVIAQASGVWPCRSALDRRYRDRFCALAKAAPPRRLRWIGRHQNLAGIALDRRR
ncbi:hypothetical protein GCM10022281_10390 [Sphingomonas rosea]|uniref:RNase H type-1 domain-containing protein n=1 Tax=Sphingomonas rosea TaxID=335605 RepID=A0ABP7TXT5_9SPHN